MCIKFQLSVSESSRDIKGIVLPAGSVHLQAREWQFDPDSASQRQFPLLPPTAAIRYSLSTMSHCSHVTVNITYDYVMFCWQDFCAEKLRKPPPRSFKPANDNLYACGRGSFDTIYATSYNTAPKLRVNQSINQSINQLFVY